MLPSPGPVVCVPPSASAYAPDGFSLSAPESADVYGVEAATVPVAPPVPPVRDLAAVLGVTLEEFAKSSVDGIENVMRRAEKLLETQEVIEAYIALGNEFLASTPDPASVSGPDAPTNLRELMSPD